jgi:hypothetical protein
MFDVATESEEYELSLEGRKHVSVERNAEFNIYYFI